MALRIRGKNNYYHAYFRSLEKLPDGSLRSKMVTVNLYTTDRVLAKAMEAELMRKNQIIRQHQRAKANEIKIAIAAGERSPEDLPKIVRKTRERRLRIDQALESAAKYKTIGESAAKHFRHFTKKVAVRYMDEVTADIAFDYLCRRFPEGSGKSFNNCKSAINHVFRLTLLDAGISASPFELIPNRVLDGKHQRPFSEEEFVKIYNAAPEPWRSACVIAWFTGLRQKDVFTLKWCQIAGDVITTTPAKTSRFGRAVQIPVHPQLAAYLTLLPRQGDRVLGAWEYKPNQSAFRQQFSSLLEQLQIRENQFGIVNFNSFRDSFITRCDAAGIPRHAIRGIVGHISDAQTDLYSHDLATARLVQQLPTVKLDKNTKL